MLVTILSTVGQDIDHYNHKNYCSTKDNENLSFNNENLSFNNEPLDEAKKYLI